MLDVGVSHQQNGLHWADAVVLRTPVSTVIVESFFQDVLVAGEVHMGVGDPPVGTQLTGLIHWRRREAQKQEREQWQVVNLRPADDVNGPRGGFVIEQLHIWNGLRHLEGFVLLRAFLLLIRFLKHHHDGVDQVLQI